MMRYFCDCCDRQISLEENVGRRTFEDVGWVRRPAPHAGLGNNVAVRLSAALKGDAWNNHDLCLDCALKAVNDAFKKFKQPEPEGPTPRERKFSVASDTVVRSNSTPGSVLIMTAYYTLDELLAKGWLVESTR